MLHINLQWRGYVDLNNADVARLTSDDAACLDVGAVPHCSIYLQLTIYSLKPLNIKTGKVQG